MSIKFHVLNKFKLEETPLQIYQILQILQILQNYPNERFRTPIAEIADIANIAELQASILKEGNDLIRMNYDNEAPLSECFIGTSLKNTKKAII